MFCIKQVTKPRIQIQILFIAVSYSNSMFSLAFWTLLFPQYRFASVHVYIKKKSLEKISFRVSVIFRTPMTLASVYWYIKLSSLRLISYTNLHVIFWFLKPLRLLRCTIFILSHPVWFISDTESTFTIFIVYYFHGASHQTITHQTNHWTDPTQLYQWLYIYIIIISICRNEYIYYFPP